MLLRSFFGCPVIDGDHFTVRSLNKSRITKIVVAESIDLKIISEDYLRSPGDALITAEPCKHLISGSISVDAAQPAVFE